MDNFIDHHTVTKLRLRTQKLPQAWKVLNVDSTLNRSGAIKHCVHLYIQRGNKHIRTQFFVSNLGSDRVILGYPWLEAFNPTMLRRSRHIPCC